MVRKSAGPAGKPRPRKPRKPDAGLRALRKLIAQTRREHLRMVHRAAQAQRLADALAAKLRDAEARLATAEASLSAPGPRKKTSSSVSPRSRRSTKPAAGAKPKSSSAGRRKSSPGPRNKTSSSVGPRSRRSTKPAAGAKRTSSPPGPKSRTRTRGAGSTGAPRRGPNRPGAAGGGRPQRPRGRKRA